MTDPTYFDAKKDAAMLLSLWACEDGDGAMEFSRSIADEHGRPYAARVVKLALTIERRRVAA